MRWCTPSIFAKEALDGAGDGSDDDDSRFVICCAIRPVPGTWHFIGLGMEMGVQSTLILDRAGEDLA